MRTAETVTRLKKTRLSLFLPLASLPGFTVDYLSPEDKAKHRVICSLVFRDSLKEYLLSLECVDGIKKPAIA